MHFINVLCLSRLIQRKYYSFLCSDKIIKSKISFSMKCTRFSIFSDQCKCIFNNKKMRSYHFYLFLYVLLDKCKQECIRTSVVQSVMYILLLLNNFFAHHDTLNLLYLVYDDNTWNSIARTWVFEEVTGDILWMNMA